MCFRAANSHGLDFKFSVTYCSQCSLPHPAAHQLAMLRHTPHSLSSPETPLLDCPKQPAFQVLKSMSSVTLPPPALDTPVSPLSLACRPRASASPRTEKSAALAGDPDPPHTEAGAVVASRTSEHRWSLLPSDDTSKPGIVKSEGALQFVRVPAPPVSDPDGGS